MWIRCWLPCGASVPLMNNSSYEEQLLLHGQLVYTNVGNSMMPLLRQRKDLIVIDRKGENRLKKYDVILYRRPTGQYVLHRILKVCKDDYKLCGDNQWEPEFGVKDEWILGVMTAFVRDGKETPVTNKWYRCYVHLWCDFYYIRAGILIIRDLPRILKRKFGR